MHIYLKIAIGVILGFLTSGGVIWPENNRFSYIKGSLSIETILILSIFGLCAGVWVGLASLKDRKQKKRILNRYIDLYSYFLVGCSWVSAKGLYYMSDLSMYDGRYLTIYFFGFIGIGLALSGVIHLLKKDKGNLTC